MSEHGDIPHMEPESSEDMVEEDFYNESDEVILAPQEPITRKDIRELVKSWEDKFDNITEGMRALQMSTHDVHTHLDTVTRESHARESALTSTNRQIDSIKEALARFMEAYDPAHPTPVSTHVQPLCTHGDHDGPSASSTSAHAHSTSRAYQEHAYHTAGGTPEIPHGVLLVPCDPGHTNGSHARRQGGNQSGNHVRRRNWNDNEHQ